MSRVILPFFAFFALLPVFASANEMTGKVISISPDQTFIVRDNSKKKHRVRLAWVEIPDRRQPFFNEARRFLKRLLNKMVTVEWNADADPIVGRILVGMTDVNLELVKRGLAWFDPAQLGELSTTDREMYPYTEAEAKKNKAGLWKQKKPVPPWEFRELASEKQKKTKQKKRKPASH